MTKFRPLAVASMLICLVSALMPSPASAQYTAAPLRFEKDPSQTLFTNGHLDLGLNVGTTGLGLELSTPITDWVRVRAGVNWIPPINFPMHFDVTTFGGSESLSGSQIERLQEILEWYDLDVQSSVQMDAKPSMADFKFLVDFSPIPDYRDWHVTVGFYYGSHRIGKAVNSPEGGAAMAAMKMYNRLYEYFINDEFFDGPPPGFENTGMTLSPDVGMEMKEKFERYGRMGIHVGNFKDGTPYYMEPNRKAMAEARCYVNRFKPYLGIGYNTCPTSDNRLRIGFDAGVLFWGGTPDIINQEGVNMTRDLVDVQGKVGSYLSFVKALKVLPAISFKISYTLF